MLGAIDTMIYSRKEFKLQNKFIFYGKLHWLHCMVASDDKPKNENNLLAPRLAASLSGAADLNLTK